MTDAMISDKKDEMGSMLGYTDKGFPIYCVLKALTLKMSRKRIS